MNNNHVKKHKRGNVMKYILMEFVQQVVRETFESVACDDDFNFCATEDYKTGALRRCAPAKSTLQDAINTKDCWKILTTKGKSVDHLVLKPKTKIPVCLNGYPA